MERSQDKTNLKQEAVKREEPKDLKHGGQSKDVKHEGARETRPERPVVERDIKPLQKRDEEQDKQAPLEKRDEEQDKQGFKPDYGKDVEAEVEGDVDDAPDMAETESGNVVKTKPDDKQAPSQGL